MKRLCIILSFLLLSAFSVSAYASVKIDGKDNGIEWQNAEYFLMINEPRVNNVDFAYVKSQVSSEYEVDFLLFLSDKFQNYDKSGFVLNINNNLEIKVSWSGTEVDGDLSEYYVDSKVADVGEGGISCEIKVGFRRGLPKEISAGACFIDGNGSYSYYHPLTVENPYYIEITEISTERTTQNKTVKPTEKKTEKKTEATKKNNPTEIKAETTKIKTTKKNADKTVVYFYEKEIIVSQVYVSESENNPIVNSESLQSEPAVTSSGVVSLSQGLKIQRVICIAGGLLLAAFGAWASISSKNKKSVTDKDNNGENNEE